ncbi:hypothetical protein C9374_013525 [Naegleria lovaniensis]|uniref:Major facilitator superfamily (MFS) profile domain-containing protein n=1 Tax=Naegleria lovaniensis TaxID=51637 RepID=A0AA88GZG7_NAELO|nr:uncharacterized protein C9374_013525 [Naegleria lovaniensis]KAG2392040.1 hypothetical protein C9374_013525 [Naegleria lovaniensis]
MQLPQSLLRVKEALSRFVDRYNRFGRRVFGPKVLLGYLVILNLFIYFDRGVVSGILDKLEKKWDLSKSEQGGLGSAFMVGYMIFGPIFAQLAVKIPLKFVMFIGLVIWACLTILCGFTGIISDKTGFFLLAACRCLVGVGEAAYAPVAPTLLDDVAPAKYRTIYMGIFYLAMPVGVALGYGVSSLIASFLDWTVVFIGEGIAIVPFALLLLMIPPSDQYRKDRIEREESERILGENNSLLEKREESSSQVSSLENSESQASVAVLSETDVTSQAADGNAPEEDRHYHLFQAIYHLVKNPVYMFALMGYTMYTFVIGALAFWGPTLVSKTLHIPMYAASLAFSAVSVVTGIVGSITGGIVLDKIGGSKGMAGSARGLMLCAIFIFIALLIGFGAFSTDIIAVYFILLFMAEFFIFSITSPVNVAFLSVVSTNLRNYSMSFQIFVIHAIGDFPSPYAMGWFADYIGKKNGLKISILFLWSILAFSVIFFFFGFLIARSKAKMEEKRQALQDLKKESYQRAKSGL